LIFYESKAKTESHGVLSISRELFQQMCETLNIPAIFVRAVFETPWRAHACGQGYFVDSGLDSGLDINAAGEITGMSM
jgi:hypothetical protein